MLTGEQAIQGENSIQIIGRQLIPMSFLLPPELDLPPELRAIVNCMLHKEIAQRFRSSEDVTQALLALSSLPEQPARLGHVARLAPSFTDEDEVVGLPADSMEIFWDIPDLSDSIDFHP